MDAETPPVKRKRGAPKGNSNALKHGYWSAAAYEDRREIRAIVRRGNAIAAMARVIARLCVHSEIARFRREGAPPDASFEDRLHLYRMATANGVPTIEALACARVTPSDLPRRLRRTALSHLALAAHLYKTEDQFGEGSHPNENQVRIDAALARIRDLETRFPDLAEPVPAPAPRQSRRDLPVAPPRNRRTDPPRAAVIGRAP